jgi:hypothetical protein
MHEKGRHLDLSSDVSPPSSGPTDEAKPFLGVHFTCCDVYARVYPNRNLTAYVGHCPKCAKRVQFQVGPGGTDARFFTAG